MSSKMRRKNEVKPLEVEQPLTTTIEVKHEEINEGTQAELTDQTVRNIQTENEIYTREENPRNLSDYELQVNEEGFYDLVHIPQSGRTVRERSEINNNMGEGANVRYDDNLIEIPEQPDQELNPQNPPAEVPPVNETTWTRIINRLKRLGTFGYLNRTLEPIPHYRLTRWQNSTFFLGVYIFAVGLYDLFEVGGQSMQMSTHKTFYLSDQLPQLQILDEHFYPTIFLYLNFLVILVVCLGIRYALVPQFDKVFYFYLDAARAYFILGVLVFSYQLTQYDKYEPSEVEMKDLHEKMRSEMQIVNDSIPSSWIDTQILFECCGLDSPADWNKVEGFGKEKHRKSLTDDLNKIPLFCPDLPKLEKGYNHNNSRYGCYEVIKKLFRTDHFKLHYRIFKTFIPFVVFYLLLGTIYSNLQ